MHKMDELPVVSVKCMARL